MKKIINLTLVVALIGLQAFGFKSPGGKDPLEITYIKNNKVKADKVYQEQLRKSVQWQNYISTHNKWFVEFNEANQKPHRAYGKPIKADGSNPAEAAMNFIINNLSDWNIKTENLKYQSQNFSGKYFNVFYKQIYKGLEVLNSTVSVKMTSDYRVNSWGLDVFEINISPTPALDVNAAIEKSKNGIKQSIVEISTPVLKILPVPEGRIIISHLVYELTVSVKNSQNVPSKYYTLIDANSGEILYRHNKVKFVNPMNSDVTVSSTVYEMQPFIPAVMLPLRNLKTVAGANTYYTDSLGNVTLSGANPISTEFFLEGLWSKVVTDMGTTSPSILESLASGTTNLIFDSATSIRHTSGYFHVNNIHDFMKSFFPAFTAMDFPLPTRVDVTGGFCNAYWTGSDINFFETGSGCNCMSQIADIVYHEYGHGINDLFYQSLSASFQNGAMHEGYSDVWGISLTQNPILGKGTTIGNPNDFIRRYDVNRKVYPQDIQGQPHADGEIIAGAWYDVSLNLNSWPLMTELFAATYFDLITGMDGDEGRIFSDILLAALIQDDDDADLSNGTPNDQAIIDAFELHGITLINNATFEHNQLLAASSLQPVTITADLFSVIPFLPTELELHYRTDISNPFITLQMSLVSGNTYSGIIPQQNPGTVISYYIKLVDLTTSGYSTLPAEADSVSPNIPYFILVDCIRDKIEDFDANQTSGWQTSVTGDDATRGLWLIGAPVVSFKSGDTCQPGVQHTPGGINCAVTGNAPSSSSPNYNQNVDNGKTTLQSPPIDISNSLEPVITYWRWYTNDQGSAPRTDFWQTYISGDGINFISVENCGVPDHRWRRFALKVSDYIPSATSVTLRFVGEDTNPGSVVEVAVDDIEIYSKDLGTGIVRHEDFFNISVYPNPATTKLIVDLNLKKSENITFDVVNNLGQTVFSTKANFSGGKNSKSLDIQILENGIYYLLINGNERMMERSFTILR